MGVPIIDEKLLKQLNDDLQDVIILTDVSVDIPSSVEK